MVSVSDHKRIQSQDRWARGFRDGARELAAELIQKACWREHLTDRHKPLILHSDNGSPMKVATFLERLYDLGITPSYSRTRVNNNAFATLAEAQDWVE
ncbi:MAG: hypothetical protein ACTH3D_06345 [Halomonas sp.]|uniref:hypothetical protein n=1 Tax=Halomonas sp. TaxID=1486246 RepID=UPI003F915B68